MDIFKIETILQFKRREDNITISLIKIESFSKRYQRQLPPRYHATYNIITITPEMIEEAYFIHYGRCIYRFGTLRKETKRFMRMCKIPMKFSGEDVIVSFGLE